MWRISGRGRRGLAVVIVTCLAQVLLVGCGGSSTPTAQEQLCNSITDLKASAADLERLSLDSSRTEVQQSVDGFLTALRKVSDNVGGVLKANANTIEKSLNQLSSNIGNLPDNASIGDVVAAVQQSIPALKAAVNEVLSGADCNGG